MQPHRLALLAIAALVTACAEQPFIDARAPSLVAKPDDAMRTTGQFAVCYAGQDYAAAEQIARERCASYGFQSEMVLVRRYQCRASAPHRATFRCFHPEMADVKGKYINPFDPDAIEEWRKRTGKTQPAQPVPGWGAGESVVVPGSPAPTGRQPESQGAPPPAVVGPAAPGPVQSMPGTGDIPGWPTPEISPPPPLPPDLEAAPDAGFSLPMGSWGQAFGE